MAEPHRLDICSLYGWRSLINPLNTSFFFRCKFTSLLALIFFTLLISFFDFCSRVTSFCWIFFFVWPFSRFTFFCWIYWFFFQFFFSIYTILLALLMFNLIWFLTYFVLLALLIFSLNYISNLHYFVSLIDLFFSYFVADLFLYRLYWFFFFTTPSNTFPLLWTKCSCLVIWMLI